MQQKSNTVFFVHPTDPACEKYFEDQGFYKEFRIQQRDKTIEAAARSTSVGLRRIDSFEPLFFETIAMWLNRNLSLPEESIMQAVTIPFSFPGSCINIEFDNKKIATLGLDEENENFGS